MLLPNNGLGPCAPMVHGVICRGLGWTKGQAKPCLLLLGTHAADSLRRNDLDVHHEDVSMGWCWIVGSGRIESERHVLERPGLDRFAVSIDHVVEGTKNVLHLRDQKPEIDIERQTEVSVSVADGIEGDSLLG